MNQFPKSAFDTFFDETVAVASVRDNVTRRVSIAVCVFSGGTEETISEGAVDGEMERIAFVTREGDWPFVQSLRRGDAIERTDGSKWGVLTVRRDEVVGLIIEARRTK